MSSTPESRTEFAKTLFAAIGVFALCIGLVYAQMKGWLPTPRFVASIVHAAQSGDAPPANGPRVAHRVIALLPGEHANLLNKQFRKVEFRSEYLISIDTGHCHANNVVQWRCEGEPADLFVIDNRRPPVFATPRANSINITFIEY